MDISWCRLHQGLEQFAPDTPRAPAMEAVIDRRGRPVDAWRVPPTATGLEHMDDAANHATIINPMGTRLVFRKQRLNGRPLLITQPEL